MNEDTWNSLPDDLQQIFLDENISGLWQAQTYMIDTLETETRAWLDQYLKDEGYEGLYNLPEDELARWRGVLDPMYERWLETATGVVGADKAQAILDDAIKFGGEYGLTDEISNNAIDWLTKWGYPGY